MVYVFGNSNMSTEYKGTECLTGALNMVGYFGGTERGECVQLTFNTPTEIYGKKHTDFSNDMGSWFLNMTKSQALDLAAALVEFANGKREEVA